MNTIKHLSFYTGVGTAELALKNIFKENYKIVGYSEIKPGAIKFYNLNFPGHTNFGDINKIKINELPNADIFTAGFPCQDVSLAGLRNLEKGRTTTVFKLLEIIKAKKPKYILLENVKGIISIENGDFLKDGK